MVCESDKSFVVRWRLPDERQPHQESHAPGSARYLRQRARCLRYQTSGARSQILLLMLTVRTAQNVRIQRWIRRECLRMEEGLRQAEPASARLYEQQVGYLVLCG